MKKLIKWFFRILFALIGLIIIAIIVIPMLFKDEMLVMVKDEINKNVNAKVEFADFKLSLLKSFPDLNIGLYDMSVTGIDKFEGDTLMYFKSFNVQVDLVSAFKKDVMVKGIVLDNPFINGIVLADSSVNWDIAVPSEALPDTALVTEPETEVADTASEPLPYRLELQKFQIKDANIFYTDNTSGMEAKLKDFDFLLKGDFGMDYSDLSINTSIEDIMVKMAGIKYLNKAHFSFDATIGADLENMIFTFKDNLLALNAIELGFDGKVEMPGDDIVVDVNFNTKKTSFKSLLWMVPAIYMQGFEELKTAGNLALKGDVKGIYNETQMPLVNLQLLVENAMFQYPDLPKAVENVNIDLVVFYDGVVNDNTKVDLNKFHVEVAQNPFDIMMHLRTPFSDPYIEATLDGHIILKTLADVVPMEDSNIDGEITADVDIAGNLSTIENEKYEEFNAKGMLQLKNFLFESPDLPAAVKIIETTFNFTPQYLELKNFDAEIGQSDFNLKGKIENYVAYALSDGTLKGDFKFKSKNINANEFLSESGETAVPETEVKEEPEVATADTVSAMGVFEVPGNIDFILNSELNHIIYDKMDITNLTGVFVIKDNKVMMNNLNMNLLDGKLGIDGEYNTQNIEAPSVTMALDIEKMEIESALNSFSMLEKMAPILKNCKGKISLDFNFTSLLDSAMSPVLNSIDGYGKLHSERIQVVDSETLNKITGFLKMGDKSSNEFKDVNISFTIKDGRINVKPFDIKLLDINMNVGGSHGIDQTMDYDLVLDVPRKYFGSAANSALESLLKEAESKGVKLNVSENIKVKAKIIGTTNDPKISFNYKDDSGDASQSVKQELKQKAEDEARKELEAEAKKIVEDAEVEAAKIKEEARVAADKVLADANKEADELVKKAAKEGPLAKIAAEKAATELKKKARTKADDLIKEADKKADGIVATAKVKADNIQK